MVHYTNAAERSRRMKTAKKKKKKKPLLDLATRKLWRFGKNNLVS